ncbi:uncharacterized protein BT62DRAFT_930147 [Guyanagaster necrorhizus]|uniref:Uncharacterized protein n=1 Tax=Guyanagaster necrorhizus TaxID=856835 RepID=A0A9P7VX48_9AGAR|nr:uncharacterized protein BT62DRAFT_930147 [Guyanagaster necrorhizus MCA 3950]KAG7448065.1 hypothetical protein BT62DRAFT_930147 [Guyanagaster necrorhizus MCA 3950]
MVLDGTITPIRILLFHSQELSSRTNGSWICATFGPLKFSASTSAVMEGVELCVTGPGWIYVLVDDVPGKGLKTMVGDDKGPDIDKEALEHVLKHTETV